MGLRNEKDCKEKNFQVWVWVKGKKTREGGAYSASSYGRKGKMVKTSIVPYRIYEYDIKCLGGIEIQTWQLIYKEQELFVHTEVMTLYVYINFHTVLYLFIDVDICLERSKYKLWWTFFRVITRTICPYWRVFMFIFIPTPGSLICSYRCRLMPWKDKKGFLRDSVKKNKNNLSIKECIYVCIKQSI